MLTFVRKHLPVAKVNALSSHSFHETNESWFEYRYMDQDDVEKNLNQLADREEIQKVVKVRKGKSKSKKRARDLGEEYRNFYYIGS